MGPVACCMAIFGFTGRARALSCRPCCAADASAPQSGIARDHHRINSRPLVRVGNRERNAGDLQQLVAHALGNETRPLAAVWPNIIAQSHDGRGLNPAARTPRPRTMWSHLGASPGDA